MDNKRESLWMVKKKSMIYSKEYTYIISMFTYIYMHIISLIYIMY